MIDSPTTSRVLGSWIPLIFLLGVACSPSTTSRGEAEKPATVTLTRVNGRIDFARLRRDLAAYTLGPKHVRTRRGACSGCLVDIDIQTIGRSYDIDPVRGPGGYRIIGQFHNRDTKDAEEMYALLPGRTYLVWVDQAPLNQAGTSRTIWGTLNTDDPEANPVKRGYVVWCHRDGYANKTSNLDIYSCDPNARHPYQDLSYKSSMSGGASITSLIERVVHGPEAASLYSAGETWFECDPGCCSGTSVMQ